MNTTQRSSEKNRKDLIAPFAQGLLTSFFYYILVLNCFRVLHKTFPVVKKDLEWRIPFTTYSTDMNETVNPPH